MQLAQVVDLPKKAVKATPSRNPFAFQLLMTIMIAAGVTFLVANLYPKQFGAFMDFMFMLMDVLWFYGQKWASIAITYIGGLRG